MGKVSEYFGVLPEVEDATILSEKRPARLRKLQRTLGKLTLIVAILGGSYYVTSENGLDSLGDLPKADSKYISKTRESIRLDLVEDYSKSNALNKYAMSYIDPPAFFSSPGGKGALGWVGSTFFEIGSDNYIASGTSNCLRGTDYDPYRFMDVNGEVQNGAQVLTYGSDTIVIRPVDSNKPDLILSGASDEYGGLDLLRSADIWIAVAEGCDELATS